MRMNQRHNFVFIFVLLISTWFPIKVIATPQAQSAEHQPTPFPVTTTTTSTTTTSTIRIQCEYNSLSAALFDGSGSSFGYLPGTQSAAACIRNSLLNARNQCQQLPLLEVDDCVAWKVIGASHNVWHVGGNYPTYGTQSPWVPFAKHTIVNSGKFRLSSHVYIKQDSSGQCTGVQDIPAGVSACYGGTFYWYSSPISLIFDENVDINKDIRLVNFALDPRKPNSWSLWKASASAPLLVYDPQHSGHINSAYQLFGDWAFGGKGFAHQRPTNDLKVSDFDHNQAPTPWDNGYQALAVLDTNGDERISGSELEPLALWFDKNRNGVSETGEVVSITATGVINLYYHHNRIEQETNSLIADRGFDRIVDGREVTGRSVDWRADTASSFNELLSRYLSNTLPTGYLVPATEDVAPIIESECRHADLGKKETAAAQVSGIKDTVDNLSGLWEWKSNQSSPDSPPGGFIGFADDGSGKLRGNSYTSFGVSNKQVGFSNIFSVVTLLGNKTKVKKGLYRINFSLEPESTSSLKSTVYFDTKKQQLSGKTLARVSKGTKAVDLEYTWTATRVKKTEF